jgi:hypothetical protein
MLKSVFIFMEAPPPACGRQATLPSVDEPVESGRELVSFDY